ncbi:MAG: tyrosine-type recombinase/integrase [Xanthobacteraceae bacterium]
MLPRDVQKVVKPSGKAYYYYAPRRGAPGAGKRISLGSDTSDPDFWRRLREASTPIAARQGTLSKLIAEYKASKAFGDLRPASKRGYTHFLDRFEASGGDRPVAAMTRRDIYVLLDQMSATPVAANYMLAVLRTILEFGVPRGYRNDNPALGVKRLKVEDKGHAPWPEAGYAFVMKQAPTHLRRMAFLGRATGQRVSDLVKMRPADLVADGINVCISKLRNKPHFVPLTSAQMAEIKSWHVRDLEFFIATLGGRGFVASYLNRVWREWRAAEAAVGIRDLRMSIHGLRATKISDLRSIGTEDGAIADEIGISVKMISRYLRFADKAASARASRDRRERKMAEFENSKAV